MIWNGFHVEQNLDKVAWNLTCPMGLRPGARGFGS